MLSLGDIGYLFTFTQVFVYPTVKGLQPPPLKGLSEMFFGLLPSAQVQVICQ